MVVRTDTFTAAGMLAINRMGSPGSGKTRTGEGIVE